jgi:XTP/dITP diphosphohydrolase
MAPAAESPSFRPALRQGLPERLLLATRNAHKLSEIRGLLADVRIEIVSLAEIGLPPDPAENSLESFATFGENALAKARYFRRRTGMATISDDSGLQVDALDGAPGVRSRRFAPPGRAEGEGQDAANNAYLLELLRHVPEKERRAHYRCALAMVSECMTVLVGGRVDGRIAERARGSGGFGYDPLFVLAGDGRTYGEVPPEVKMRTSHRAAAIRALRSWLLAGPDPQRARGSGVKAT